MTIDEKILLEEERHTKKLDEIRALVEAEYSLYAKNKDALNKEKEQEQSVYNQIALSHFEPFPIDGGEKVPEEMSARINEHLRNGISDEGIAENAGTTFQPPFQARLNTEAPIITPKFDPEQLTKYGFTFEEDSESPKTMH